LSPTPPGWEESFLYVLLKVSQFSYVFVDLLKVFPEFSEAVTDVSSRHVNHRVFLLPGSRTVGHLTFRHSEYGCDSVSIPDV